MKTRSIILICILLITTYCSLITGAAVPAAINYQGKLINGTNLVNAQVSLVLRVYTNATTGDFLFEDSNVVTVVDGLYSTALGAHPTFGTLTNALAGGEAWIEVEVNGTTLSPREQLLSAPYALDGNFVAKSGDTMTGDLTVTGAVVRINREVDRGFGTYSMLIIDGGESIEIGSHANGYHGGVAVGPSASGYYSGVAVGPGAVGDGLGAAVGVNANGLSDGAAVGHAANASYWGAAVGEGADGYRYGTAMGRGAVAEQRGVAAGDSAVGTNCGVAVGGEANGSQTNVAIGYGATANGGAQRIAIGSGVSNTNNNSAVVRGTLYLDGTPGMIYYRPTFGSGGWSNLVGEKVAAATTNYVLRTGDTMTGALTINAGGFTPRLAIDSAGQDISIGGSATGALAVGWQANGVYGVAIGPQANGFMGVAVGPGATASMASALGYGARAGDGGTAIGGNSEAYAVAVALGNDANGSVEGTALGYNAKAAQSGVAVGYYANGIAGNIAVGRQADTVSGTLRIAVGYGITNAIDNSAALRGTLYLDGGTGVYYRSTFGSGAWSDLRSGLATGTPLYAFTESDPLFSASVASAISAVQTDQWSQAYGWGNHAAVGYAMAANLTTASNSLQTQVDGKVSKTGDTMTGALIVSNTVYASYLDNRGSGPRPMLSINGGEDIEIGDANGYLCGVAIGFHANATNYGVAMGRAAVGTEYGVGIGLSAQAVDSGVAVGLGAQASDEGIGVGANAEAPNQGVAVGRWSRGAGGGVAVGYSTHGFDYGVAIGYGANGAQTNIAIGHDANASGGSERIALGHSVTNSVDNSAAIRGTLYLDGGTGILYRTGFGSGSWGNLLTDQVETEVVPYAFGTATNSGWRNNTGGADYEWDNLNIGMNAYDHGTNGVITLKVRVFAFCDGATNLWVGVRNSTDSTYPIAHTQTATMNNATPKWWESGWMTVTNSTGIKELRVTSYTDDGSKYYFIKKAVLLVKYQKRLSD